MYVLTSRRLTNHFEGQLLLDVHRGSTRHSLDTYKISPWTDDKRKQGRETFFICPTQLISVRSILVIAFQVVSIDKCKRHITAGKHGGGDLVDSPLHKSTNFGMCHLVFALSICDLARSLQVVSKDKLRETPDRLPSHPSGEAACCLANFKPKWWCAFLRNSC